MNNKNKPLYTSADVTAKNSPFDDIMAFFNGKNATSSAVKAPLKTTSQNLSSQLTKEFNDLKK